MTRRRLDEDGQPGDGGEITEHAANTRDEIVMFRMPLRLPFHRGRRRWLVVRAYTATARVTLATE